MLNITNIPFPLKQDIFLDASHKPQVITVRDFNEVALEKFTKEFNDAVQRRQPIIPINIDSFGGQVYSLRPMINMIRNAPVPVATFTQSKAMSCGAFLLGFGTPGYRFVSPTAKVMIHEVSGGAGGKVNEIIADGNEAMELNNELFEALSLHCGWSKDYFHRLIHKKSHADWYLKADELKKRHIIDVIGTPQLTTTVTIETTVELVNNSGH